MADRSVTIRLRVSSAEFDAAMAKAGLSVEALAAEVKTAGAAAGDGGKGIDSFAKSTDRAHKSSVSWLATLAALTPALIPIAGAAALGGAAFVGLGTTAVTALLGIKKEQAEGSRVGQQYAAGLQTIKTDFGELERTAARNILAGFNGSVDELHRAVPMVDKDMAVFSQDLGGIAKHSISGLLGEWKDLDPQIRQVAGSATTASARFDAWANGPGGERFAQALADDWREVAPVVKDVGTSLEHLFHAADGSAALSVIDGIAKGIDAIPEPVLETVVPLLSTTVILMKGMSIAETIAGKVSKLGAGLKTMAAGEEAAATAGAAFKSTMGPLGIILGGGYIATQALGDKLDVLANKFATGKIMADQNADGLDALQTQYQYATGKLDDTSEAVLHFALSGKMAGDGINDLSDKTVALLPHMKSIGISATDLEKGLAGNDAQYQLLIRSVERHGGATKDDMQALKDLRTIFHDMGDATQQLTTDQQALADKLGISADTANKYAAMVGVTTTGTAAWAAAVKTVSDAFVTASATGSEFLQQEQQFAASAGTSADRAALISATLKAAAGDTLAYQATVNAAAVAQQGLSQAIHQAASQVGKDGVSTKAYLNSIVDLKTGAIDFKDAAAAPLIDSLQQIQDANLKVASATFQHNRALGVDGKRAADLAYNQYVARTGPMLEHELTSLGLNATAAHKLAQQYLGVPSKVKTLIEQEGADPVVTVLHDIDHILTLIARSWGIDVNANTKPATSHISGVNDALHGLHGKTVAVGADTHAAENALAELNRRIQSMEHPVITPVVSSPSLPASGHLKQAAGGGEIHGPGTSTSDSIPARLSDGEYVVNAASYDKHKALVQAINADRFAGGGEVGAHGGTMPLHFVPELTLARSGTALGLAQIIRQEEPTATAAMRDLSAAVNATFDLKGMSKEIDQARDKLSTLQQDAASLRTDTTSGLRQGFNPALAGLSTAGIVAAFGQQTSTANKFTSETHALSVAGLNKDYLAELERQGPSGTLDALAKIAGGPGGRGQIAEISKAFATYQSATAHAGAVAANDVYASAIRDQSRQVNSLVTTYRRSEASINRLVNAVVRLTNRPVEIRLDGKVVAQASAHHSARVSI